MTAAADRDLAALLDASRDLPGATLASVRSRLTARLHRQSAAPEVMIGGVRYVPVSQAHIGVPALEDAIVGQWGGGNWRTDYPDAPGYLRVVVGDSFESGEGESVTEFVARLLAGLEEA